MKLEILKILTDNEFGAQVLFGDYITGVKKEHFERISGEIADIKNKWNPTKLPEPDTEYDVRFSDGTEGRLMYWNHFEGFDPQTEPHGLEVTHFKSIDK